MEFIVFTKHFKSLSLGDLIRALKEIGVSGADLCVRPGYPVEPDTVEGALPAAAAEFRAAGLSIPLITMPTDFTDPKQPAAERVFSACRAAGVSLLKLGYWQPGSDGYAATVKRVRRDLEGFAKLAARYGVRALVHNHSGNHMGCNSSAAMDLVGGMDPRHVGVFADPGHLSICGEPLPMALDIVKDYLAAIAAKDMIRKKRGEDWQTPVVPLGEGYVNWRAAAGWAAANGFSGPISLHSEYEGMSAGPLAEQTRRDAAFLSSVLDGAGKDRPGR